ncbi:hypothetical protein SS50377_26422 [Spironucleus salmonicida]|nr:hypothetical protein SS50377_28808 [Spironucleus salmonicida]KAH0572213.1 hypothetical protein SS50377_26422 [Spironucleus salmonicida]
MAQLALEELKRRQLQNTEPIHPLHNFPWEPTFKNLTPEWLCGCLTSQTAVQCLASKKGAYKIMLYFERLKKDIMLKAEIKAKNKNKNSILLLTK